MQTPLPNSLSAKYISLMDTLTYCLLALEDEPHGFGAIQWLAIRFVNPTSICCVNLRT